MSKVFVALPILCFSFFCKAQTPQTTYYDNNYKEVVKRKARYVKTTMENGDGSMTVKSVDLKNGDARTETYKNGEPYGIWSDGEHELDYNFKLAYKTDKCIDKTLPQLNHYFADVDSLGYKAPKISPNQDFYYFLVRHTRYPSRAKENGIQGKVVAQFIIDSDGSIHDISIVSSAHVWLDKEFVRVLRKMKFAIPATINGQPVELCVTAPMNFRLE